MKDSQAIQDLIKALGQIFPMPESSEGEGDGKSHKVMVVSVQKGKGVKIPRTGKSKVEKPKVDSDTEQDG